MGRKGYSLHKNKFHQMKKDKFPKRSSADWIQSELTSSFNSNKDISNKTHKKVEDKSTDPVCNTKTPTVVSSSKKRSDKGAQSSIDTAKIHSKDTKQIFESKDKDKIGKASSVEIDDLFQSIKRQKASNSSQLLQTVQQQSVKLTEEDKVFCDTKGIKRTSKV